MKPILILTCVCLTACVVSTPAMAQGEQTDSTSQQIERKYDRFKDQTTVSLKPQMISHVTRPREELSLSVEATYKGERPSRPKEVSLIFHSVAERYVYYDKADVVFIVDSRRVEAGTAYMMNAMPSPNLVKVKLKLTLPFDTFRQIAGGKEVELKLGSTELKLKEKDLASLRAFASSFVEESKGAR
jgi:hypothetical protein